MKDMELHADHPVRRRVILAVVFVGLAIAGVAGGVAIAMVLGRGSGVPASIQSQVPFPLFGPTQLPGSYKLDPKTFSVQENGHLVVFAAKDETGVNMSFSEQAKPDKFDFAQFYNTQMQDAKTLDNVPYPSVWGKTSDQQSLLLSIVTDKTWILMTTRVPFDDQAMQSIVRGLQH